MAGSDVQESLLLELTDQLLEWKFLGRHLGLTERILDDIERNYKGDSKEIKYQTLLKWKQTSEQRPTIGKLAKALKKAERADLADYVMQDKSEEGKAEASQAVDLVNDKNAIQMNSLGPSQSGDESARYVNKRLRSDIGPSVNKRLRSNIGPSDKSEEGKAEASQAVDLVNDKIAIQMNSLGPSQSGDESARYVNKRLRSDIGPSDQQWQFEPEEFGDQYVHEHVLCILATRIFRNHGGKELSDVPYFCSQLGIPSTVFNPVCMDRKKSRTDEILYYVFREWSMASSLTRNKLRKALFDFDQGNKTSLCKLYVKIVNDRFREDSSENS